MTAENWPYATNAVFNPAAAKLNNETLLLVRVEDMRGFSHLTVASLVGGILIAAGIAALLARRFDLGAALCGVGGLLVLSAFVSSSAASGFLTREQFERILFGVFIIGFLIFEPLGLYGIWIRMRNYWKAWPFSY